MCKKTIPLISIVLWVICGIFSAPSKWGFVYFWCISTVILIMQFCIPCINKYYSKYVSKLFFFSGISSIVMCYATIVDATTIAKGPLAMGCSPIAFILFIILMIINFSLVTLWHHARSGSNKFTAQQLLYQDKISQLKNSIEKDNLDRELCKPCKPTIDENIDCTKIEKDTF